MQKGIHRAVKTGGFQTSVDLLWSSDPGPAHRGRELPRAKKKPSSAEGMESLRISNRDSILCIT